MKKFKRGHDDYFAVVADEQGEYKIGIFKERAWDEGYVPKPYYIHKLKFKTKEQAEQVCELVSEEYNDGFTEGYEL